MSSLVRAIHSGQSSRITRELGVVNRPNGVGAITDAAKPLTVGAPETQICNVPITADRAVTPSTVGAYAGARFHVTRTAAATGAFNLNVVGSTTRALTAGQWCEVTFNGTAWVVTAAGSL
jgi:hypothetical protein